MTSSAIELVGFELQVANVAYNAGFNTTNHQALFDLIWAVKRTTLRPPPFRLPPPPPHPVYPDRYRPSGVGDNTNKKRKRNVDAPNAVPNAHVVLQFNPVPPLMRPGGSKEDPIKLEEDDKQDEVAVQGHRKRVKRTANTAPASNNAALDTILKVSRSLEAVRLDLNGCQANMRIMFDKNRDKFDENIIEVFGSLAEAMNKAYDGSVEAGKFANKAASLTTFKGPVF